MAKKSTFIIFGATGGIGSTLSRQLTKKGNQLILASRNQESLQLLSDELDQPHFAVDATVSAQVEKCFQYGLEQFDSLDGVVYCVGSMLLKPAHRTTDEEWFEQINLNLNSAFFVVRDAVRAMLKSGGSIVLMSSCAARVGIANHEAIASAKAGVIGLTLSAAASYANRGIRVNCVAPGLVRTSLTESITGNERALSMSESMHALGRVGEPEDIVPAIEWLLSKESSWVTGQVIGVDGGLGTIQPRITV